MQIHPAEAAAKPWGKNPRQEVSLCDSSTPPIPTTALLFSSVHSFLCLFAFSLSVQMLKPTLCFLHIYYVYITHSICHDNIHSCSPYHHFSFISRLYIRAHFTHVIFFFIIIILTLVCVSLWFIWGFHFVYFSFSLIYLEVCHRLIENPPLYISISQVELSGRRAAVNLRDNLPQSRGGKQWVSTERDTPCCLGN